MSSPRSGPETLEHRLRANRQRRAAAQLMDLTKLAGWIAGSALLVSFIAGGLLNLLR